VIETPETSANGLTGCQVRSSATTELQELNGLWKYSLSSFPYALAIREKRLSTGVEHGCRCLPFVVWVGNNLSFTASTLNQYLLFTVLLCQNAQVYWNDLKKFGLSNRYA